MRGKLTLLAGVCAAAVATPSFAQNAQSADSGPGVQEIIVTAQRQSQRLQAVPIAISAFTKENLDKQQIRNPLDLQLSLPNVTFTKTNFTTSSFTIRGIGDLCTGVTCDSATAIHINDAPLFATRLFEGEFYDLAQVEVLRGPQGTLFGRNATSGVVNFRTAKPDLNGFGASGDAEYGNYNSVRLRGMINIPLGETLAVRAAGFYLKRDGYTTNLYNNSKIDDRDIYGFRGSLTWQPSPSTTVDLMGQYFREKDSRMRIQKQYCQEDPTGILGCLNTTRGTSTTNGNALLANVLTSKEFFAIRGLPTAFALGSIYGPGVYSKEVNPADPRIVNTDFQPSYFTEETILQGTIKQDIGEKFSLRIEGNYQNVKVDSQQDYNNAVADRSGFAAGLGALAAAGAGLLGPGLKTYLNPIANALIPQGPGGPLCTSQGEATGTGVFGGHSVCAATPLDFDRSVQNNKSWTAEAVLTSKFDGPINFLLGGIYGKYTLTENSYYVSSFGLDYFAGVVGAFSALGAGAPPAYLATSAYRNNTPDYKLTTYGIFGEAYWKFNDKLKLTLGLRYNNDSKSVKARTTLFNFLAPVGIANAYDSPFLAASYDADSGIAGNQPFQIRNVKFGEWTGRAVLDYQISPDHLLYASYSRGYKSGGINPPLSPIFAVPESFTPEFVNSFEIGSKNSFGNGALQLNLTGFYYQYKGLQLSRIVARTSVNDNVSANIYGVEAEAIVRPTRELTINMNFSYLNTKVSEDKFLSNPRDFGNGRKDAVIIKDITNTANCAVGSNSGSVAGVNAFVNTANALINAGQIPGVVGGAGLKNTTPFPANGGIASTGAYSICAVLTALAPTLGNAPGIGGVTVYSSGIATNIRGNKLPGAPNVKFSTGVQYAAPIGNLTLTPRFDLNFTGKTDGTIFNGVVDRIPSFTQLNAQLQLDGPDKKWFIRGFVQNITNDDSVTGLYVTDQSSGNFTNVFTLEPRRYGVAAGFKF
ncbi:MAG: TonB-dependent receptor [Novosphingobium sp.]|uniref:TonB-dependent receptor n=1 Tax=Novosphingobium sp. TaxID=1874826 RepID=UPI00301B3333